ncbi:MAG: oligosaccharide flippase family protein [Burkholderiales bacterium]
MVAAADGLLRALRSSFGARLAMAVLNYGLFWVLSHRFDAAELGGYSVLMNLFFLLQMLPLLGLSAPLARRIAGEPASLAAEFSNALAFALPVAAVLGAGIVVVGLVGYEQALHPSFVLLGLALLPTGWTLVAEMSLLGRERMSLVARAQAFESLGRAVLAIAAVEAGGGLTAVFGVFFALRCAAALWYAWQPALPRFDRAQLSRLLWRRNWCEVPVFLGIAVAAAVATRIDLIVLAQLAGLQAAGIYAAASRLYEATLMLPTVAAMVMLPALARLYRGDRARFDAMLLAALRLSLGAGFAVALAVAALAEPLIGLLYAPHLAAAAPVLRWLIFAAVLTTADQLLSSTMIAAQAQHDDLRTMLIAVAALALGLALLVPTQGALGAAMAVPLALALRLAWRLRWAARRLALPDLGHLLARLGLAWALGALALAGGLLLGPLPALLASLGTYALALWASGLLATMRTFTPVPPPADLPATGPT